MVGTYKVSESTVTAFVLLDRTNHSVHMHFFGEMPDKKRTPIHTRRINLELPAGKDDEIARQMITDYGPIADLQVGRALKANDNEEAAMEGLPVRIIVRFRK